MWNDFDPSRYIQSTKTSHRKRGFKIQVKARDLMTMLEDVYVFGCPYCGKPCEPPKGTVYQPNAFSLDVKDPEVKEITKKNVQIICQECNKKKGHMSHTMYLQQFEA